MTKPIRCRVKPIEYEDRPWAVSFSKLFKGYGVRKVQFARQANVILVIANNGTDTKQVKQAVCKMHSTNRKCRFVVIAAEEPAMNGDIKGKLKHIPGYEKNILSKALNAVIQTRTG